MTKVMKAVVEMSNETMTVEARVARVKTDNGGGHRWVFELKIDGESLIPKGRLVAKGFHQIPFIDFGRTFAPVAKSASIRLVAAIAC
jgi:hypothetical protein